MLTSIVNKLWKPIVILGFAAKLLFSEPSYAQETGTIDGTVLNQLNNPVSSLNVRAEQVENRDLFYSINTDENGYYRLGSVVVPVELMSFTGKYNLKNNNLELNWTTATETNNYGFDVEQLVDNEWKKIGFVKGNGNSDIERDYSFLINNNNLESGLEAGDHSLRLKQVDFNGDFEYYSLNINIPKPTKAELGNAYPTGGSIINFPVKLNQEGEVEYKIFTVSGKQVKKEIKEFNPGYFTLNWKGLNDSGFKVARESYIINIKGKDFNISKVFSYNPNGPIPLTNFIDKNSFKSNEVLTFRANLEDKLNKTIGSGVVYDFIFSGPNILTDTLKNITLSKDTTINQIVTEVINVEANVKDNYSNNNLIKDNVPEAELSSDNYTAQTDENGNTTLRIPINQNRSYEIKIRKDNFFTRTASISSTEDDYTLNEEIVPYPTSVSADTFRAFCEEANFGTCGLGYTGLKTMFGNPNAQYWISSHYDLGECGIATAEDQAYVKNLTENEIYPNIKEENRLSIYVENPDSIETIPYNQGKTLVLPRNHPKFGIGSWDDNKDGIIDGNEVFLPQGQWNESYKKRILEELLSALIGPGEVVNFSGLTALQANGVITEMDKMLIKICEFYEPKTQIDDILGK